MFTVGLSITVWSLLRGLLGPGKIRTRQAHLIIAGLAALTGTAVAVAVASGHLSGPVTSSYTMPAAVFVGVVCSEVLALMVCHLVLPPAPARVHQ